MCEIFVIEPSRNEAELVEANARDMYSKNPDGIGLVAIYRNDGKFEYETYKNPDYEAGEVSSFITAHMDAWRMVVHARLATHGDTEKPQTHPIKHEGCEQCDIEMVVHNGVVNAEEGWRESLKEDGHEFNTYVDSEVILHEHGSVPTDIDDLEQSELTGSLNFILFQEDAILMRSGYKYDDAEHFVMGKKKRCEWEDSSRKKKFLLVTPDGEVETKEVERKTGSSSSTSTRTGGYDGSFQQGNWWSGRRSGGSRRRGSNDSQSGSSTSGSSSGSSGSDNERPNKAYKDWEDWPPEHLVPQEAS